MSWVLYQLGLRCYEPKAEPYWVLLPIASRDIPIAARLHSHCMLAISPWSNDYAENIAGRAYEFLGDNLPTSWATRQDIVTS